MNRRLNPRRRTAGEDLADMFVDMEQGPATGDLGWDQGQAVEAAESKRRAAVARILDPTSTDWQERKARALGAVDDVVWRCAQPSE